MVLFEQHPYCARRRSRASGYRRPCCSRVWSASREATLPSFFRAGCRLYRSRTVCISAGALISTVDSLSFLILAFVCHAYPAFVLHPRFHQKPQSLFLVFRFRCSPFGPARILQSIYSILSEKLSDYGITRPRGTQDTPGTLGCFGIGLYLAVRDAYEIEPRFSFRFSVCFR